MQLTTLILLIVIGIVAGIFSGVFGIGGGIVMIPLLAFALGFTQHEAQGTSLAVLAVPVTFLAAYNYYEAGHVNWKYAIIIAVTFALGGYLGSKIAILIEQNVLKKIFALLMIVVALRMLFSK
ncbi:MAG TPA: sulfite exporter TauE/SafE family protein [Flavobacteriaceae bacterium]|jgi:uncharacterized membrane protein YfcA|nr:sulfite exporter TauE/SafE family protein [Flavobacteriaceae bacterium]